MLQLQSRIAIPLWFLLLTLHIGQSITCTAIGNEWTTLTENARKKGNVDIHGRFDCDKWGASTDYFLSFDFKLLSYPTANWSPVVHLGYSFASPPYVDTHTIQTPLFVCVRALSLSQKRQPQHGAPPRLLL